MQSDTESITKGKNRRGRPSGSHKKPVYSSESSSESESVENEEESDEEIKTKSDNSQSKSSFFISIFNPEFKIPPHPIPIDINGYSVQHILGIQENSDDEEKNHGSYFIKWSGRSHIHATMETIKDIYTFDGGDSALKKFLNKSKGGMIQSLSYPSLSTPNQEDINASWFEVDRVVFFEQNKYLIKWGGLPYEQCTWENEEDIPSQVAIEEFRRRKPKNNPMRINAPLMLDISKFKTIDEPFEDKDGNKLRDYQLKGLNWLRFCWYSRRNSILADEMGLGKTVQIVSVLNDISKSHKINGPFLILAPLSTLGHWKYEFEQWSDLNAIVYHGNSLSKDVIQRYEMTAYDESGKPLLDRVSFDVLVSNYETFMTDFEVFSRIHWRYMVLDEGHRLKNHNGKCYKLLSQLVFQHCTLLTGTPIQNNVEELWSLLHFLHPQLFPDLAKFLEDFGVIDKAKTVQSLQTIIQPFLLRRKKSDVETSILAKEETIIEVELTRVQKTYYKAFLDDNASVLLTHITQGSLPSLQNLMMQLRKVCNHPYLIKGATPLIEEEFKKKMDENATSNDVSLRALVNSSGKLILIDKLLPKLKSSGHKVLIFSQMVKVLDILEEYLHILGHNFERIDGTVSENDRQSAIDRFGSDPNAFIFLLCTRAGGVGINLTAADTVIIYDSDWNPQNDIQAQSRCHRIGQKAKVKVYRLVTRGTYELEMLDRASKKLGLDHAILDGAEVLKQSPMAAKEIEKLLRRGVYDIIKDDSEIDKFCEADIEQILDSRSKSFTRDVIQSDSLFSKAKFDPEKDTLDMNSREFWSVVFPQIKEKKVEILEPRRCKANKTSLYEDSDDEDSKSSKKRGGSSGIRSTIKGITTHGFTGTVGEKAVLYHASLNSELEEKEKGIICSLLRIDTLDEKPDGIESFESRVSTGMKEVIERKKSIVSRTMLFYNIDIVISSIQGHVNSWPVYGLENDPLFEYALLYAVKLNGFTEPEKQFIGTGFVYNKNLYDKQIVTYVKTIVSSLLPLSDGHRKISSSLMTPDEWKETHGSLFNRSSLSDDEYVNIFLTILTIGLPEIKDEEGNTKIDYQKIHDFSHLSCIKHESIVSACQEIHDLSKEDLDQFTSEFVQKRLGLYSNRVWMSKLRTNIKDLRKIRRFYQIIGDSEKLLMAKIKTFENGPDWWGAEHDLALIKALCETGLAYVSQWVVDPEGPFIDYIPPSSLDEFKKCAEIEVMKSKPQKPKEPGDFGSLYTDKIRISRVLTLIQYVEARIEKERRSLNQLSSDQPNHHIPLLTELPELPLDLGNQLTILNYGEYSSPSDQYPVGYVSKRQYCSIINPTDKAWYEATTRVSAEGQFQFVVTLIDDSSYQYVSHTSSGAWEKLIQAIQKEKGKRGLEKRKHTTVSGPFMYGFSHPTVTECLSILKEKARNV